MSAVLPPFLTTLGLTDPSPDLDERALRRAYARNLKLIDVETEPERFQALRESLDQALRWLAWRDQARKAGDGAVSAPAAPSSATPSDVPPATAAPSARPAPKAEEIGVAIFTSFHRQMLQGLRDESDVRKSLDAALADEALLNIDARTFFEWSVARLLAGGWRAGHEHLLGPSIDAFGWASDHARLAHFGQVGAMLSAAIRDRSTFHAFDDAQRLVLDALIARLRDGVPPAATSLKEEVPQLQFLVQRVPNWLRIVSPVEPVNQRFEMWRQTQASPPQRIPQPTPQFVSKGPASELGPPALIMMVLMLLFGLGSLARHTPDHPVPRPTASLDEAARDAQMIRRQKQAEALLANAVAASRLPPPRQDGGKRATSPDAMPPLPASLGTPWWQPALAGAPGNAAPDQLQPLSTAPSY